jgi:phospholipid/cholesterol/gamma-HCH transport system substrate-binding protein
VIPSVPSPIDRIMDDAPLVVARVAELAERLTAILDEDNARNLDRLIDNAADATASLARALQTFEIVALDAGQTLRNVDRTLAGAERLAADARAMVADFQSAARTAGALAPQAGAAIEEMRRTAGGFGRVADEIEKLAAATRPGMQDFGQNGLYELQQFMLEGRALITTLNRVVANFERDPARFLFGDQQKGLETK